MTYHMLLAALALAILPTVHATAAGDDDRPWCDSFSPNKAELTDTGRNTYFVLWPGHRLLLRHADDTLTISVLKETKIVDGVKTRVVEERETKAGKLVEVSRNYFAISRTTGDVYYFGEDVDHYKDGKVIGHEGSWQAGVNGARFGLMMPGFPALNDRYHQEVAPGVAMDRAEVVGLREDVAAPAKNFERCLRIRETSTLESGTSDKLYAPDVGLVQDGKLLLTEIDCPLCKNPKAAPQGKP